jgi:hypothetical protein
MICDTCKLKNACDLTVPYFVEDFVIERCSQHIEALTPPKGPVAKIYKALLAWADSGNCPSEYCDDCVLQTFCEDLTEMAAAAAAIRDNLA